MRTREQARQRGKEIVAEQALMLERAKVEDRDFTPAENDHWEDLNTEFDEVQTDLKIFRMDPNYVPRNDGYKPDPNAGMGKVEIRSNDRMENAKMTGSGSMMCWCFLARENPTPARHTPDL